MTVVVWKYEVPDGEGSFELKLPDDARFAHLAVMGGELCLWFVVDPSAPLRTRRFLARDTGQPLEDGAFVGYVQFLGTYMVWLATLSTWNVRHVWMEV